jgi:hypothetical protein
LTKKKQNPANELVDKNVKALSPLHKNTLIDRGNSLVSELMSNDLNSQLSKFIHLECVMVINSGACTLPDSTLVIIRKLAIHNNFTVHVELESIEIEKDVFFEGYDENMSMEKFFPFVSDSGTRTRVDTFLRGKRDAVDLNLETFPIPLRRGYSQLILNREYVNLYQRISSQLGEVFLLRNKVEVYLFEKNRKLYETIYEADERYSQYLMARKMKDGSYRKDSIDYMKEEYRKYFPDGIK